jgi:type IV pilus assembly protein PilB
MYPDIKELQKILLDESYISKEDSANAAEVSRTSDEFIDFLIHQEILSKPLLGQALAEYYGISFVDLGSMTISKEDIALIPEATAREQRVIFLKTSGELVALATDQPKNIDQKKLADLFKHKKIRLYYALPDAINESFMLYEQALPTRFAEIIEHGASIAPEIVDEIIKDALHYQASDIHFEPDEEEVVVRFRVDGSLREAGRIPRRFYINVLNRIKVESGMRIDEHFSSQDGSIQHVIEGQATDLRISLIPTVQGEKVVMRVLGSYVQGFSLSDVGLTDHQEVLLKQHSSRPFGMILTVGPTGSGKTTTLYAILKLLNKPNVNITTIEDPVEYRMHGTNQIQVNEQANMTFSKGLRSIVRQDPDIILVGEIRDEETAEISVNAALTGHLLLSTFHANNAATAIPRLIDMGIEPFLLASTLELVIAQRLVRKICSYCRHSVNVHAYIKATGIDESMEKYFKKTDTIYAGKGCSHCNASGYKGRVALFEFIEMTPAMQDLLPKNPSSPDIERLARQEGSLSMFQDGIDKVRSGMTTIAELLRVVPPAVKKRSEDK